MSRPPGTDIVFAQHYLASIIPPRRLSPPGANVARSNIQFIKIIVPESVVVDVCKRYT